MLSAEEAVRLLEVARGPGLKYRAAFSVAYGGGPRASEVTHLKIGDIVPYASLIGTWSLIFNHLKIRGENLTNPVQSPAGFQKVLVQA